MDFQKQQTGFIKAGLLIWVFALIAATASCTEKRFERPLLGTGPSAAADKDIYITDAAGRVHALRPDGTEQWVLSLSEQFVKLDSSYSGDIRIDYLIAQSGGKLYGLATQETGPKAGNTILFGLEGKNLAWHADVPYPEQNSAPIAVSSTTVYEAGNDGSLYAYSISDGKQLWKSPISQGSLGSPTVGPDGTVYVTGVRHNLHAISPDGTQKWVAETEK
jgi:outer membrane protein assembly factor BamB